MVEPDINADGASLVLVADSVRARLFAAAAPTAPLAEVAGMVNAESRMHERDLVEDAGGRRFHRPTQAKRSAFGGQTAKRHRTEEFAAEVLARMEGELQRARARRVYVVAEPEFLGILRQRMRPPLQRCIAGEIAKSLTGKDVESIRELLPQRL